MITLNKKDLLEVAKKNKAGRRRMLIFGIVFSSITLLSFCVVMFRSVGGFVFSIISVGVWVFFSVHMYKRFSESDVCYRSVEKDNYYIKLIPITAKNYEEDTDSISHYMFFSSGEKVLITYREYKYYNVGDVFYVVYSLESDDIICYFNTNRYELGCDIVDKLEKTE